MIRRPWLHRPGHAEIDRLLELRADHCRFANRLHPEEFAAEHLQAPGTIGDAVHIAPLLVL